MNSKLFKACENFAKLASTKLALGPAPVPNAKINTLPKHTDPQRQKGIKLWSDTLMAAIKAMSGMFSSSTKAQAIFQQIAPFRQHYGYNEPPVLREVGAIRAALELSEEKLRGMGLDPLAVMKQHGMQNLNPNTLNVLKQNIDAIFEGKDYSKYRHYTLAIPERADIIELDEPETPKNDSGY